uniref:Ig-like domain-containing protein n=1 Tax=Denticeps clupeoides TaxID=299321 RepID=A0AAY4AEI5_9TELE
MTDRHIYLCNSVNQSPENTPGESVQNTCNHSISSYYTILWYQRLEGETALELVRYIYHSNPDTDTSYKDNFDMSGDGQNMANLTFKAGSSAVYFCAASRAHCCWDLHFTSKTSSKSRKPP